MWSLQRVASKSAPSGITSGGDSCQPSVARRRATGSNSADSVRRLRFIRHAQDLGFSLDEIHELLALRVRDSASCKTVAQRTRRKVELVEQRILDLQRLRRTLQGLAAACAARRTTELCPILEALDDDAVGG